MLGSLSMTNKGILGINARNIDYIFANNPRKHYQLVDDKLQTKKLAVASNIACPELYGIIEQQHQVKQIETIVAQRSSFVIKPAHGSGGGGILVIKDHIGGFYKKPDGKLLGAADIRYHLNNVLSGLYSLGGKSDKAIIEYCVESDPAFNAVSVQGVPDIRVIVYKGVPTMAMLRLPTHESSGKANLHVGGVGVGINMQTGTTTYGVHHDRAITHHPDTREAIADIQIPHWRHLLELTSKFKTILGMGYIGVDIVLDAEHGPMMLEVNVRPGIAIQTANRAGLKERLDQIDEFVDGEQNVDELVDFAQESFLR